VAKPTNIGGQSRSNRTTHVFIGSRTQLTNTTSFIGFFIFVDTDEYIQIIFVGFEPFFYSIGVNQEHWPKIKDKIVAQKK
jgi:hypothetical protein